LLPNLQGIAMSIQREQSHRPKFAPTIHHEEFYQIRIYQNFHTANLMGTRSGILEGE